MRLLSNKFLSTTIAFHCAVLAMSCYGQSIKGWTEVGTAHWKLADGIIQSEPGGKGFLVTTASYTDFKITLDFWNEDNFSGVLLRCGDLKNINRSTAYKVTINKDEPDNPEFITGGVSGLVNPSVVMRVAGKWNTYEITIKGKHINVKLNGVQTANIDNDLFKSGPIALQTGMGVTKFRNIVIKPL